MNSYSSSAHTSLLVSELLSLAIAISFKGQLLPDQIVDDGNIAGTIAASGQNAHRLTFVQNAMGGKELTQDRGSPIDATSLFTPLGCSDTRKRFAGGADISTSLRAPS